MSTFKVDSLTRRSGDDTKAPTIPGLTDASGNPVVPSDAEFSSLDSRVSVLETEVGPANSSRIDQLETDLNALEAIAWTSANDGSGSGLDADLLDGLDSTFFLNAANLTGTLNEARLPTTINSDKTFTGNIVIGGDLTVNGTSFLVNTDNIAVEDSLLKFARNNTANTLDLGFYAQYQPSVTPTYAGFFLDATDGVWKLFSGLEAEPTTTVDTAGTGFTFAPLSSGHIKINTLSATSRALDASTLSVTNVASAATFDLRLTAYATTTGAYTNRAADFVITPEIASGVTNTSACSGAVVTAYRNINAANTDQGTLTAMRGLSVVFGHFNTVGGNSPTTTTVYGVPAFPTCRSGSITTLAGFFSEALSSTGGTVGTHIGYDTGNLNTTPATTVYGFRGQTSSGVNRWNLYMSGTAINYLNGALLIGTTTDDGINKLQVSGSASFGNVQVDQTLRVKANTVAQNAVIRGIGAGTIPDFSGVSLVPSFETGLTYDISQNSLVFGGMNQLAWTGNSASALVMQFQGHHGSTTPSVPTFVFSGWKHNGTTGRTAITGSETHTEWRAGASAIASLTAAGNFTSQGTSHTFGANANSDTVININAAAGANRLLYFNTAGSARWIMQVDSTAESGSNAGSNWSLLARNDAGVAIDTPISIVRAAGGAITITRNLISSAASINITAASGDANFITSGVSGQVRGMFMRTAGVNRWYIISNNAAETGSDAGSSFVIGAYTDAGVTIDTPLTITRASGGAITIGGTTARPVTLTGNLTVNGTGHQFGANTNAGTIIGLNSAAGNNRQFQFRSANVLRWNLLATSAAESGSDAGTSFGIAAYNDAGTFIDNILVSLRAAAGTITIGGSTLRPTTFTGTIQVDGVSSTFGTNTSAGVNVILNSAGGNDRNVALRTAGVNRWIINASSATESGSDAGSNFNILAYTDAGANIDAPVSIVRVAGGAITLGGTTARPVTLTGALVVNGNATLGDASGDSLTINAGVWTLGSNYIANRAMGTLASGSTVAQQFNVSATGNADGTSNPLAHALTLTISGANNLNLPRVYNGSFVNNSTGTVTQVRGYAMNIAQSSVGGTLTETRGASISTQINNTGGIGTAYDYLAEAPLMSSTGTIGTHVGFSSQNLGHANINTAIGFSASDITASVTMMGFRGLVTSGTGKWNLFMSGTAANHLQGDTLIGTSSGDGASKLQVTGQTAITGNLKLQAAGNGLYIKEGTNATMGVATLAAGTVTVNTTKVTANSRIFLTGQSDGGTVGFHRVSARSAGTSFTITSSSGTDTSTVAWMIVEPA